MVLSRSWLFNSTRFMCAATIVATAGNAAAGGRAEDAAELNPSAIAGFNVSAGSRTPAYSRGAADSPGAHPSVSVDLSVIDEPGTGAVRRTLTRPDGLRMPVPGIFPESQLHEPDPDVLPYGTLTPPRQRAVNLRPPGSRGSTPRIRALALANPTPPPRPQEPVPIPRPQTANTSIGEEPVAITAPSRTGGAVAPTSPLPQSLSPQDAIPPSPAPTPSPDPATALAASDHSAITPPFSGTSTSAPVPPATETVSAPQVNPEPADSSATPQIQQASLSSSATATAPELESQTETTPDSDWEKAATPTPPSQTEEKTVALQPAARSEEAMPPPAEEFIATGELVQVAFDASETNLTGGSRAELKELAERLRSQENMRLQLLAYAEGDGLSPSKARRLSRALTVRSYLIENGIKTSRIDVRALGNKATSSPLDRVDVKVVQR